MIYYLGLGTNLGQKEENLQQAIFLLKQKLHLLQKSSVYKSSPMGPPDQDDYLNMVIAIESSLEPLDLLEFTKSIEQRMGRVKTRVWGERIIDLDILLVKDEETYLKVDLGEELQIPHPGILEREFVLRPLAEIAKVDLEDYYGKSVETLLSQVKYKL